MNTPDRERSDYIAHLERRVDELLKAINDEVERRREAEALLQLSQMTTDMLMRMNADLHNKYNELTKLKPNWCAGPGA
jgi:hypothetical protein